MASTDFIVKLIAQIDKSGLPSDVKVIQDILNRSTLKMIPKLEDASIKNQLQSLSSLIAKDFNKKFNLNVNAKDVMSALKSVQKEFGVTEQQAKKLQASLNILKADALNKMSAYLRNNSALSKEFTAEVKNIMSAIDRVDDVSGLKNLEKQFKSVQLAAKATGQTGRSVWGQVKKDFSNFGTFLGVGTVTMQAINQIRNAFNEFKEVDTILTEIAKTSGQAREELESLGKTAYESASRWGVAATDYLKVVQEMNRSGFTGKKGEDMADLTMMAMSAGDLDANLAQKYILATNAAYGYKASVEDITKALDMQNILTDRNSVSLQDMAEATSIVGSLAANSGVKIDELSAIIGTLVSTTKQSGSEVANATKAIIMNLQNVGSNKIIDTLDKANASMFTMKDGIEQLRTPVQILDDLAKTFNSLDEADPLRAEITTNIGGKLRSSYLSSLLKNWDVYKKQLKDTTEGAGSAMREANLCLVVQ